MKSSLLFCPIQLGSLHFFFKGVLIQFFQKFILGTLTFFLSFFLTITQLRILKEEEFHWFNDWQVKQNLVDTWLYIILSFYERERKDPTIFNIHSQRQTNDLEFFSILESTKARRALKRERGRTTFRTKKLSMWGQNKRKERTDKM